MLEPLQLRLDGLELLHQVLGVVLRVQNAQAASDDVEASNCELPPGMKKSPRIKVESTHTLYVARSLSLSG